MKFVNPDKGVCGTIRKIKNRSDLDMEEKKYTSLIRLRMSAKDAHYGGTWWTALTWSICSAMWPPSC